MEVKIDEEQVNKVVSEAIIKSALGKQLTEAINKALDNAIRGYNSPVEKLVREYLHQAIKEQIETNHKERINKLIAEEFTEDKIKTILQMSVSKAVEHIRQYSGD